jgi:hypothetical protein
MTKFFSAQTGGFYDLGIHGNNMPADAVEITDTLHTELLYGQSNGKVIAPDKDGMPILQDPPPPPPPDPKLTGIEIEGVMCSATKDDQAGLIAVLTAYQLQGAAFKPTLFEFVNGNSLLITKDNIQEVITKWTPFRQSFFAVT